MKTEEHIEAITRAAKDYADWRETFGEEKAWAQLKAAIRAAQPAGAQQPGAAYAALPDEGEPWRGHKFKEVQRGCWRCDCGKTIKEVTSDQSTPASGGNYPVMPKRYTVDDDGEELFTAEKMRAFADATHALRVESLAAAYREELDKLSQRNYELRLASHGQAPAGRLTTKLQSTRCCGANTAKNWTRW